MGYFFERPGKTVLALWPFFLVRMPFPDLDFDRARSHQTGDFSSSGFLFPERIIGFSRPVLWQWFPPWMFIVFWPLARYTVRSLLRKQLSLRHQTCIICNVGSFSLHYCYSQRRKSCIN